MIKQPTFTNQHETFAEVVWETLPYLPPTDAHGLPIPLGAISVATAKNRKIRNLIRRVRNYEPAHQL